MTFYLFEIPVIFIMWKTLTSNNKRDQVDMLTSGFKKIDNRNLPILKVLLENVRT